VGGATRLGNENEGRTPCKRVDDERSCGGFKRRKGPASMVDARYPVASITSRWLNGREFCEEIAKVSSFEHDASLLCRSDWASGKEQVQLQEQTDARPTFAKPSHTVTRFHLFAPRQPPALATPLNWWFMVR